MYPGAGRQKKTLPVCICLCVSCYAKKVPLFLDKPLYKNCLKFLIYMHSETLDLFPGKIFTTIFIFIILNP